MFYQSTSMGDEKIFIVDDIETNRLILEEIIKNMGCSPILFETFLHIRERQDSLVVEPDSLPDYFDYLDGKDFFEINEAAYQATVAAHSQKLPCLTLELDALDAYHFGQLFYFFAFACYLSCKLTGVNPFDQPGVEAYKAWMFEALGKGKGKKA